MYSSSEFMQVCFFSVQILSLPRFGGMNFIQIFFFLQRRNYIIQQWARIIRVVELCGFAYSLCCLMFPVITHQHGANYSVVIFSCIYYFPESPEHTIRHSQNIFQFISVCPNSFTLYFSEYLSISTKMFYETLTQGPSYTPSTLQNLKELDFFLLHFFFEGVFLTYIDSFEMVITSYVLVFSKYEENIPYPTPPFAKMYSPTLFS